MEQENGGGRRSGRLNLQLGEFRCAPKHSRLETEPGGGGKEGGDEWARGRGKGGREGGSEQCKLNCDDNWI